MAYVSPNYKTKKALQEALAQGREIDVYQPFMGNVPRDGYVGLEGPHAPAAHTWYGSGTMKDGKLVSVK